MNISNSHKSIGLIAESEGDEMRVFTSRYSNPALKSGEYAAICISVGRPRWPLGYALAGEIDGLKPFGLVGRYDEDKEEYERLYVAKLEKIGAEAITQRLDSFGRGGKSVVLLCYEDIRKGDGDWCHRRMFAEWYERRTGIAVPELGDPSQVKNAKPFASLGKAMGASPSRTATTQMTFPGM
jgi:hypothetical protein